MGSELKSATSFDSMPCTTSTKILSCTQHRTHSDDFSSNKRCSSSSSNTFNKKSKSPAVNSDLSQFCDPKAQCSSMFIRIWPPIYCHYLPGR